MAFIVLGCGRKGFNLVLVLEEILIQESDSAVIINLGILTTCLHIHNNN